MIIASQLRPGAVLKIGGELFKVEESVYHIGQGKMPGSVHGKLKNVKGFLQGVALPAGRAARRRPSGEAGNGIPLQ